MVDKQIVATSQGMDRRNRKLDQSSHLLGNEVSVKYKSKKGRGSGCFSKN